MIQKQNCQLFMALHKTIKRIDVYAQLAVSRGFNTVKRCFSKRYVEAKRRSGFAKQKSLRQLIQQPKNELEDTKLQIAFASCEVLEGS